MQFGNRFAWLGWQFDLGAMLVSIPKTKAVKIVQLLQQLRKPARRVDRRFVEKVIGSLLWFAGGCFWFPPACQRDLICKQCGSVG